MSHYGDYLKERRAVEVIENEDGFIAFKIHGEECFLEDIYVAPEKRKTRIGSELVLQMETFAKDMSCKYVTCNVWPSAHGSTVSLKAALANGFKLHSSVVDKIILIKEL